MPASEAVESSNCEWLPQAWFEVWNGSISNPSKLKKLTNTDFLEDSWVH